MITEKLRYPMDRIARYLARAVTIWGSGCFLLTASAAAIDFSTCGYRDSSVSIPLVPIRAVVTPSGSEDDSSRIQAAIDYVSGLEADADGFRGAVLLTGGSFIVCENLELRASGVVLRGSGIASTSLRGNDVSRAPMIRIVGKPDLRIHSANSKQVVDETVPAGAAQLTLDSRDGLKIGQRLLITRPSTKEWIKSLGMDREGISWKPGSRDVRWERRVVGIEGDAITLDAPITTALEQRFGGARAEAFEWPGRISNVGVENLSLQGAGEDRTWCGVTMENVEDAWVRQVRFSKFPGSAVALWETAKSVTVQDCLSTEPDSEVGGYRRHTFFTMGQQTLFLRCWSESGWHDFSVGHCAGRSPRVRPVPGAERSQFQRHPRELGVRGAL